MQNSQQPLVSVIIPFFNEEQFLHEAVESVLLQDYSQWELLLVDDGSSDGSVGLAKAYAARHPGKIMYCEHAGHINKGLSATRNEGIRQSKGDLLAFLDADDVWLAEKLSDQVKIFEQNPDIAMVAEASLYWYSGASDDKKNVAIPVGAPAGKVYRPAELVRYLYPLSNGAAPCPSGLMVAKQAAINAGGFEESFTKQYQLYEDQAFLHKIYLKEKVFISASCNNKYRQRIGSIMQQVHEEGQYHLVRRYFLEWLEAYLIREHIQDKKTLQLLKKALVPYRYPNLYFITEQLPAKVKRFVRKGIRKAIRK